MGNLFFGFALGAIAFTKTGQEMCDSICGAAKKVISRAKQQDDKSSEQPSGTSWRDSSDS